MKPMLRKIADVVLSTSVVFLLAALVVYIAGHIGAVPY